MCRAYLPGLAALANEVLVMTSAGGLVPLDDAVLRTGLVAPVGTGRRRAGGGVRRRARAASAMRSSFDMGGTSTDVCLVRDGVPAPAPTLVIAGYPIRLPAVAVHTIGAGGGSIARLDSGGALVVGPESAGARPGPACYGRGGEHATVTDADLLLGRIPADGAFAGLGRLDADAARRALARAGVTAEGVVAVVDASMERAVRVVTVEQGIDPRDLALVAFGGAGPLHACGVADALGMRAVIVPPRAGVFSAVGLVSSPRRRELVRSWPTPGSLAGLDRAMEELGRAASAAVGTAELIETFVDCRYVGQSHEVTVPRPADFPAEHERRNGYARPARADRGRRHPGARVARRAAHDRTASRGRTPAGRRARRRDRARLHGVGAGRLGRRAGRTRRVGDGALVSAEPLDPAALQILISRLTGVAEEMGAVLRRAAYSPNIKERADCSAALFTAAGELLVQAEHIPVHLGSMPAAVAAAIAAVGGSPRPDDEIVLNDPFAGGTHLNDVTLVSPCFVRDALVGWVANRAHHADLGGMAPGSMPPDATEIYQEGLRIPPVRLDDGVAAILVASSRTPAERAGDLDAQRGANRVGVRAHARRSWTRSVGGPARRDRRLRRAAHAGGAGRPARR